MANQSNLDKIVIALAQNVAKANKAAEEAKDVAVSVDDAGKLSVNGKETAVSLITPSIVASEVAAALSTEDMPSKLADEQAEFRQTQTAANIQIALEKGVYYLEDGLTADLRGKALSGWWKTNKQTPEEAAKVSAQLTNYINRLPSGVMVKARYGSVFSVDKNVGYMPEKFGTDGRRVTVGGMTLTIDGAQPCIYIDKDSGDSRVYDFRGVTFIAESMGVNVFEITGDNNVILHGGIIRTRAVLEVGYVRGADKDKMLFAPIDGWTKERPDIGSGYADKGLWELGFNTTTLMHDISRYRNNAAQVHEVRQPEGMNKAKCAELTKKQASERYKSVGGYWDENGESAFPQDDGTTSRMWGKWRGGQRGSRGNAITLYNCRNTTIYDFDVEGFDGSAVQGGLYATQDCQDVHGGDTATAEAKGMIAYDTLICGGWFDKMYTGGIGAVRVVGFTVTGLQCQGNKVGHPDWSVEHSRDGKMVTIDPGYMLWTSRYMPMVGVVFTRNNFGTAARKVIDAHTGNDIVIEYNSGAAGYFGVSVVAEETFASKKGKDAPAEDSSFYYQESNMTVANNNIVSGIYGIHLNNGAFGVKPRKDKDLWWLRANIKVRDNIIKAPYVGMSYNYGHYGFDITGNSITFANQFGEPYGQRRLNAVTVTNGGSGYSADTYIVISGGGQRARDAAAEPVIKDGVITAVNVTKTGTRYTDAASIVVTAVDPNGTGSGATFIASVSETSTAYMIGAESRYGSMQVNFNNNRASNSPDGNFSRMLVSGSCIASFFRDNLMDITPYAKGDNPAKPYTSAKADVYRSGVASLALAQTQDHIDSFHSDNVSLNQVTGRVANLNFRNKNASTPAPAKNLSEEDILKIVDKRIAEMEKAAPKEESGKGEAAAESTVPSENTGQETNSPAKPESESEAVPTAPSPAPESPAIQEGSGTEGNQNEQTAEQQSGLVRFSFASANIGENTVNSDAGNAVLKSLLTILTGKDPEGWQGAVVNDGGFKGFKNQIAASGASRYIELTGFEKISKPSVILFPFKVLAGGRQTITPIAAAIDSSDNRVVSSAGSTLNADGTKWIAQRHNNFKINGEYAVQNAELDFDKWYIGSLNVQGEFDKLRFGTNQNANLHRHVIIGEGLEIIDAESPDLQDKLNALMSKYSRQLQPEHGIKTGLMLDTARAGYSLAAVKQAVDTVAEAGAEYLHLHFSDDEGFNVESKVLGNQAGGNVLSQAEIGEVVEYAASKGIGVIPEVGAYFHAGGILALKPEWKREGENRIDFEKREAVDGMKRLLSEMYELFRRPKYIHIGFDEFGYDAAWLTYVYNYANELAAHVKSLGATPMMWNDGVTPVSNGQLDKSVLITYWNAGDQEAELRRATIAELVASGRKVIQTDVHYLYFMARTEARYAADVEYAAGDLANFTKSEGVDGTLVAVWSEQREDAADLTVTRHIKPLLEAAVKLS